MYGGTGANTIYAGSSGDHIYARFGNNQVYGGAGFDYIYCSTAQGSWAATNWVQAGSGGADITGGWGTDWLYAGNGTSSTYYLHARGGNEHLYGGAGTTYFNNETGDGTSGDEEITGGSGTNIIDGGAYDNSHDVLVGGPSGSKNYVNPVSDWTGNPGNHLLASIQVKDSNDNFSFDGNVKPVGTNIIAYSGDDQTVAPLSPDPTSGGKWTFNDLNSGDRLGNGAIATPVAVYVTWDPSLTTGLGTGTQWASNAYYSVYDNATGLPLTFASGLTYVSVNQGVACQRNDSPFAADRPWMLLGVWNGNVTDGLTVRLYDPSYTSGCGDRLVIGDAMIHAIWPTVTVHSTDQPVNNEVIDNNADHVGDYYDWESKVSPVQISVEGDRNRVQFAVTASIDPVYYDSRSSLSSNAWQVKLPDVSGLDFWTSEWNGTQITADGNGNIIINSLSSGNTQRSFTVYTSVDPGGSLAASPNTVFIAADVSDASGGTASNVVPAATQPAAPAAAGTITRAPNGTTTVLNGAFNQQWKFTLTQPASTPVILVQFVKVTGTYEIWNGNRWLQRTVDPKGYQGYYEVIGFVAQGQQQITDNNHGFWKTFVAIKQNGYQPIAGGRVDAFDDGWQRIAPAANSDSTGNGITYTGEVKAFPLNARTWDIFYGWKNPIVSNPNSPTGTGDLMAKNSTSVPEGSDFEKLWDGKATDKPVAVETSQTKRQFTWPKNSGAGSVIDPSAGP